MIKIRIASPHAENMLKNIAFPKASSATRQDHHRVGAGLSRAVRTPASFLRS
jgi:hypothetical protein